ncbi:MAG: hypothetical protein Kow0074_21900 [Candidatus Zixiibacteriota bacterium]
MKLPNPVISTRVIPATLFLSFVLSLAGPAMAAHPICVDCDSSQTIQKRFPTPDGYHRVKVPDGSFADWLRGLMLQPPGTASRNWRGEVALDPDQVAAVLDWRLLGAEEQCADIALRLTSEFARQRDWPGRIRFRSLSGQSIEWTKWLTGKYGVNAAQTQITYTEGALRPDSRAQFDRFLQFVMNYTNTKSMARDWPEVPESSLTIGDVIIQPLCTGEGSGHLSVVVDACIDDDGNRLFLFADGYTPARVPVIRLRQPGNPSTAWMTPGQYLDVQKQFGPGTFHRYPFFPE